MLVYELETTKEKLEIAEKNVNKSIEEIQKRELKNGELLQMCDSL